MTDFKPYEGFDGVIFTYVGVWAGISFRKYGKFGVSNCASGIGNWIRGERGTRPRFISWYAGGEKYLEVFVQFLGG